MAHNFQHSLTWLQETDTLDLVVRDFSDNHDIEARDIYDNMYEERSFEDDELLGRDLFEDEFEARDLDARGKVMFYFIPEA